MGRRSRPRRDTRSLKYHNGHEICQEAASEYASQLMDERDEEIRDARAAEKAEERCVLSNRKDWQRRKDGRASFDSQSYKQSEGLAYDRDATVADAPFERNKTAAGGGCRDGPYNHIRTPPNFSDDENGNDDTNEGNTQAYEPQPEPVKTDKSDHNRGTYGSIVVPQYGRYPTLKEVHAIKKARNAKSKRHVLKGLSTPPTQDKTPFLYKGADGIIRNLGTSRGIVPRKDYGERSRWSPRLSS